MIYHALLCAECKLRTGAFQCPPGEEYICGNDCDVLNQEEWGKASEDLYYKSKEIFRAGASVGTDNDLLLRDLAEGESITVKYTKIGRFSYGWEEVINNEPLEKMKLDGVEVEYITGAKRVEASIPDYTGIPPFILRRLAMVFEEGRVKYTERNWTKGLPTSSTINHLLEHLFKWMEGERQEDHLAKVMWGIVCLMYTERYHPELNDADWSGTLAQTSTKQDSSS